MRSPYHPFAQAAAISVADTLETDVQHLVVGVPPNPAMGDFAVGCFPAAKQWKQPPQKLAEKAASAFVPNEYLESATAAGPFVNFRAVRPSLYKYLFRATHPAENDDQSAKLICTSTGAGKTICIDYSSPNISKHLAYHHIRSTVIGHALVNLYRAVGYRVVGINHLGDWGTTHGMLLAAYDNWATPDPLTVSDLNQLYVRFRQEMKEKPALESQGRAWFKRLEDGDPLARARWQKFRDVSVAEYQTIYDLLGVSFEEVRGESAYLEAMQPVLDLLAQKKLSTMSEGALVVPLEQENMPPLLLRKQDGATLYATRDLAAAIYRWDHYAFAHCLYVVDRGQSLHFQQLRSVLSKAGFPWADRCIHVPFGLVRIGGKKTGTRTGNVVLLKEVLKEAKERSRVRMMKRPENANLPASQCDQIAEQVGIGAVVFANLAAQREKDVDFAWEDVLSTDGDSGPYIQYAHARCCGILSKASQTEPLQTLATKADTTLLQHPAEWALALKLMDLGTVTHRAAHSNDPHLLSRYLLDLCALFSRWYTLGNQQPEMRILCQDPALRQARLMLVGATRRVLQTGLSLLGIAAPETM